MRLCLLRDNAEDRNICDSSVNWPLIGLVTVAGVLFLIALDTWVGKI